MGGGRTVSSALLKCSRCVLISPSSGLVSEESSVCVCERERERERGGGGVGGGRGKSNLVADAFNLPIQCLGQCVQLVFELSGIRTIPIVPASANGG
jgi:hypothetical protein